jgi:hypothetical protein
MTTISQENKQLRQQLQECQDLVMTEVKEKIIATGKIAQLEHELRFTAAKPTNTSTKFYYIIGVLLALDLLVDVIVLVEKVEGLLK